MRLTAALLTGLLTATSVAAAPARPEETKKMAFAHVLPNVPGKSMIAVEVTYPPNGASPSHTHAPSSFIFAYVLDGEIKSAVDGAPVKIYKPGESWYEAPGAHHTVSENASATKPAKLLAVFVVDSDDKNLVIPDAPKK